MTRDDPQHNEVIAGRYRLGEPIGAGGFGQVYAAVDLRLDREVAVKIVSVERAEAIDPAVVRRFVDEARSGARFTHRHAVTVFDAGRNERFLYLVTELVRGGNLADRLQQHGPLAIDAATRIADQTLQALDAAHRAGIVHRDVKPSNVLLDDHGDAKLADFGIAKRLDDLKASVTSTGQMMGTPGYVAPERSAGQPATPATDVYAVGVVLFEMLTGRPPYEGDSPIAVALAHRDAPLPDVVQWRPETPPALSGAIGRALAKDPGDRFPDAASMRHGLTHIDVSGATGDQSSGDADRTRRYPAAAAAAAGAVGGVAAGATAAATGAGPSGGPNDPGRTVPADGTPGDDDAHRRPPRWWWFATAALIGVAVWAFVTLGDDDPAQVASSTSSVTAPRRAPQAAVATTSAPPATPPTTTTIATTSTTTTTTTSTTTTTTSPPTTPAPGTSLTSLMDRLATDPGRAGNKGRDLLRELEKMTERDGEKQADHALKTIERVADWACDGSLEPGVANETFPVLLEVVATSGADPESTLDIDDIRRQYQEQCGSGDEDGDGNEGRGNDGDDDEGGD